MVDVRATDSLDSAGAGPAAVRGGVLRLAGFAAGTLVSLVAAGVMFRHLGVEDAGRLLTVVALVTVAGGITDAGLTGIALRESAQRVGPERDAVLRDLLGLRIALTLVGVAGAVGFAAVAGYGRTAVAGAAIAGVALVLQSLQSALGIGLQTSLRQGWVTVADVARQVASALAVVALAVAGARLLPFFAANVAGGLVAVGVLVAVVRGTIPLRPSVDLERWRALLRDTGTYAVATAIGAVYFRIAIVLVAMLTGERETGYFAASFRGVEVMLVVPQLLVGAAFPIFARAARDDRERLSLSIGKVFDAMLVLGLLVGVGLTAGAPVVIDVVAGPGYGPAADVLRVHGVGLVASFAAAGWGYAALSLHLHRVVLVASLSALGVNVVLVTVLTLAGGAVGAAAGTTIAEVVLAAMLAAGVRRAGVPLAPDMRALPRVLAAALLAAAVGVLLPVPSLPAAAAAVAVYCAAILSLGALPRELLGILRPR